MIVVALAGCTSEPDPACETSYLRYDNFGAAFFLDWCRGCHSTDVPGDMRQDAPIEVNFDTLGQIRARWSDIQLLVGERTMPPAGGPSDAERDLLVEWLGCGAPE